MELRPNDTMDLEKRSKMANDALQKEYKEKRRISGGKLVKESGDSLKHVMESFYKDRSLADTFSKDTYLGLGFLIIVCSVVGLAIVKLNKV